MLSTLTLPPIYSMIRFEIESPKPVPYLFLCVLASSLPKSMNSLSKFAGVIPTPVSMTLIFKFTHLFYPGMTELQTIEELLFLLLTLSGILLSLGYINDSFALLFMLINW